MLVFTLPSFPYVFKVIRDTFEPPKDTDRKTVEAKYDFVKQHDRGGRMADTLEFAHVAFPLDRLDPALLNELERLVPSQLEKVSTTDANGSKADYVVVEHLYIERRMVPLNLFIASADEASAREAIREYGQAVRELAGANIFPGDLLLKNFGVTRYGRVVFYDYDELCELTDCRFRKLPQRATTTTSSRVSLGTRSTKTTFFPSSSPHFSFRRADSASFFWSSTAISPTQRIGPRNKTA